MLCISFCFLSQKIRAQYLAKITNLNNLKEYYLLEGEKYYFQLKKVDEVFYLDFSIAEKDNLVFENRRVNPDDLSWVSKTYYKNSKLSELRRNSALNLGVMTKPTYDLEEKYLLEIVPDTAKFVLPKKK
jgi:hypothetical protein